MLCDQRVVGTQGRGRYIQDLPVFVFVDLGGRRGLLLFRVCESRTWAIDTSADGCALRVPSCATGVPVALRGAQGQRGVKDPNKPHSVRTNLIHAH